MRARLLATSIALALPLFACGSSPAPAPAAPAKPLTAPAAPAKPAMAGGPSQTATSASALPVAPAAEIKYDAKGRRDPFAPLDAQTGAKVATVATAKLRGVVRGRSGPLALVDTAEGVGYILKQGDTLADGRLVEIGQDSVVFAVAPKPGTATSRVILKLPTE